MTCKPSLYGNFIISSTDDPHPTVWTFEEAVSLRLALEKQAAVYEREADEAEKAGDVSGAVILAEFCAADLTAARDLFLACVQANGGVQ